MKHHVVDVRFDDENWVESAMIECNITNKRFYVVNLEIKDGVIKLWCPYCGTKLVLEPIRTLEVKGEVRE